MKTVIVFFIGVSALFVSLFCKSPQRPEQNVDIIQARELNEEIKCTLDTIKQNGKEARELRLKIQNLKKP